MLKRVVPEHQYIHRETGEVITERFIANKWIHFFYNENREKSSLLLRALSSQRLSALLGYLHYDSFLNRREGLELLQQMAVDISECIDPVESFVLARQVFQRKISYWHCRPMDNKACVVSPADCRILLGSFLAKSQLFIKEKFFSAQEFLGNSKWFDVFEGGDYAICRLTPDKYHYNHIPVAGVVKDLYSLDGVYHSCNPQASISLASIYSKNKRFVTVIDTNVKGGSGIGFVAMVEVVALMIGGLKEAYSTERYDAPAKLVKGMFVQKGCPKSVYAPGSSTDVLLFEKDQICFCETLIKNSKRQDVKSRFTQIDGTAHIETDIRVRQTIAYKKLPSTKGEV